jgi:uncharacterized protein YndB with AHSA1/START domain
MDSSNHISISKDFNVSVEAVYQAWTQPEQLKQWWKPMNNQLLEVKNELQPGGAIEYRFSRADAEDLVIRGNYKEVEENSKLVYTWKWDLTEAGLEPSEYVLSLNFIKQDNGSKLEIQQDSTEEQEAIQPHKEGWTQALDALAEFLSGKGSGADSNDASSGSDESTSASRPAGTVTDHIKTVDYGG